MSVTPTPVGITAPYVRQIQAGDAIEPRSRGEGRLFATFLWDFDALPRGQLEQEVEVLDDEAQAASELGVERAARTRERRRQRSVPRDAADVWWRHRNAIVRKLVPQNGARFAVLGRRDFESVNFFTLAAHDYSRTSIDGSVSRANAIPTGTVLGGVTNEGRFVKVRIDRYGQNLEIEWVTYRGGPADVPPEGFAPVVAELEDASGGAGPAESASVEAGQPMLTEQAAADQATASATAVQAEEPQQLLEMPLALEDRALAETLIEATPEFESPAFQTIAPQRFEIGQAAIPDIVQQNLRDTPQMEIMELRATEAAEPRLVDEELSEIVRRSLEERQVLDLAVERPWRLPSLEQFDFGSGVVAEEQTGSDAPAGAPSNTAVELFAGLEPAVDLTTGDISPIYPMVFADENPRSGVFYYLPRAYNIGWDPAAGDARGLGLRIHYEQGSGEDEGRVRMVVLLDAQIDLADVQLAREMLKLQSRRQGFLFRELKAFPLAAPPALSLVEALSQRFDLKPEQIFVNGLSNALDRIEVSWTTDAVTAANIRLALTEGFGLSGAAQFVPPNASDGPSPLIPVNLRIDSAETYDRFGFRRHEDMRNDRPFDLRLGHLHALVELEGRPVVLSWTLDDLALPAGAQLAIDPRHVPPEVDEAAELMWLTYALDERCDTCVDEQVAEIVIGNIGPPARRMAMTTLSPLADTGAALLQVDTRSRFFDPTERSLRDGPTITFTEDGASKPVGLIFAPDGVAPADEPPLLEYRVTAIQPSGEPCEGVSWIPTSRETTFIGSFQIERSTGRACGGEP